MPFGKKKREKVEGKRQLTPILLIILLILLTSIFFPKTKSFFFSYKVNDITTEPIIAPFNFPILKSDEELEQDREMARRNVPFLFRLNPAVDDTQLQLIEEFFKDIATIKILIEKKETSQTLLQRYRYSKRYAEVKDLALTDSLNLTLALERNKRRFNFNQNSNSWKVLTGLAGESDIIQRADRILKPKVITIVKNLYSRGILDLKKSEIISSRIAVSRGGEETIDDPRYYYDLNEAWTDAKKMLQAEFPEQGALLVNTGYDVIIHFLEPNLIFQREITESRQKEAIDRVPVSRGMILKNEKIVDANVRITPEIYWKLKSLEIEYTRQLKTKRGLRRELPIIGDVVTFLGRLLLITVIYALFFVYLRLYEARTYADRKMMILICSIFLFMVIISFTFYFQFNLSQYTIPVTLAALLFTILFNGRLAFVATTVVALMLGFQLGYKLSFSVISLFAGFAGIYTVRVLRKRSQVFQSIIYIVIAYTIGIVAHDLLQFNEINVILRHIGYAAANGILSPFLAYGVIGVMEIAFGITTDLTLLELTDFNHPLLKRLSREAIGTFNHCVAVGNLAEAAADAIGANALLARVGAYYHDIGKLSKPEYFVENQFGTVNVHDKLAPHLSSMVIINHVKEGLRLAKEYRLPQVVQDFIPTHHGTTLIEYFYHEALEKSDEKSKVMDTDFRYPGPKPFTKETGIVMLCESIEAAVRSLKNPTLNKIEDIIDRIIKKRLDEGELDECPLTIRDLKSIKGDIHTNTGILPILRGFYHLRIEYPDDKKSGKSEVTTLPPPNAMKQKKEEK